MSCSTAVSEADRSYWSKSNGQIHGPSSAFFGGSFLGPHWARVARSWCAARCSAVSASYQGPMLFGLFFSGLLFLMHSSPLASEFVVRGSVPCQQPVSAKDRGH